MNSMRQKRAVNSRMYEDIRNILVVAKGQSYSAVNFIMVEAYWNVGKRIIKEEQNGKARAGYGEQLIDNLSSRLTKEFGEGYSQQNLWNMRQFYRTFPILSALRRELRWTQ